MNIKRKKNTDNIIREEIGQNNKMTELKKPNNIIISKIGIISHDYTVSEPNGYSDYSYCFTDVIKYLDKLKCDCVLFSPYSIFKRNDFSPKKSIQKLRLKNIKILIIDEYSIDNKGKKDTIESIVLYKNNKSSIWSEYIITQIFATINSSKNDFNDKITPFIKEYSSKRIFGNFSILLCGETNIVKYSRKKDVIIDKYDFTKKISSKNNIILNPIHYRMIRHEMKKKRLFLSSKNRIVISVWNKGKIFNDGKTRDGKKEPWSIYLCGIEKNVKRQEFLTFNSNSKIEIGIIELKDIKNYKTIE